jgi:hypothetical protein
LTGTLYLRAASVDEYADVPATLAFQHDLRIFDPKGIERVGDLPVDVVSVPQWVARVYQQRLTAGTAGEEELSDSHDCLITVFFKWQDRDGREGLTLWLDWGKVIAPPFRFAGPKEVPVPKAKKRIYFYQSGCRAYYFKFGDKNRSLVPASGGLTLRDAITLRGW